MNKLSRLKRRLQLKKLELQIDQEIDWNFGYSQRTAFFNQLLERRNSLSDIIKETDNAWWLVYDEKQLRGKIKELTIFNHNE